MYDHSYVGGAGHAMTILESALISPDGGTLYLSTTASSASGRTVTAVTAYSTADGASLGTISTWEGGYPEQLSPVGGMLLSLGPGLVHRLPDQPGDPDEDHAAAARAPPRAVPDARLVIQQNHSSRVLLVWP